MSKKTPQIRFKGFTDDWEERKLGDISKVIDPHPSHRAPAATEEGIPFIGIGDVNEVGNINYKTARIVDAKIFDEHHNRYDLSIPSIGIGRVASLGKVIRLRDDIGKYVVSPTMSVIQFTNNNDLDFLYSNMNTPIFQKQFKSFSNGSTRQSVGIQDLRILMVSLPVDIEEQQKIGSFFKQLDDTIALHQRKLDLLKEQKKGFLQKMFPKNGSRVPELRFSGFADDWEQRKLKDIANYRNGKAHEQVEDIDGQFTIVNSKFISTNGNVQRHTYKQVEPLFKGEITFVLSDLPNGKALAKVFRIDEDNKYTLNQRIAGITPKKGTDSIFLSYILNRNSYFLKFDSGVSQTNLSRSQVEGFTSTLPCFEEQTEIGSFFKQLDNLITLHQRKLDLLKEQKKGFLQKMFVS